MRLRHSLTAQDDLSEARATSFVQGPSTNHDSSAVTGREVEEFVKDFKELRKTYHKRAMWSERWQAGDVTWPEDPVS
jgi:ESCRT-I complex subunit VPS37